MMPGADRNASASPGDSLRLHLLSAFKEAAYLLLLSNGIARAFALLGDFLSACPVSFIARIFT